MLKIVIYATSSVKLFLPETNTSVASLKAQFAQSCILLLFTSLKNLLKNFAFLLFDKFFKKYLGNTAFFALKGGSLQRRKMRIYDSENK
jgi:hypothetical protein